jgi:hypothetical protein
MYSYSSSELSRGLKKEEKEKRKKKKKKKKKRGKEKKKIKPAPRTPNWARSPNKAAYHDIKRGHDKSINKGGIEDEGKEENKKRKKRTKKKAKQTLLFQIPMNWNLATMD